VPETIESKSIAINLGREPKIPGRVVFVGADLNARVRLEAVAEELVQVSSLGELPESADGIVVIDLDMAEADVWTELQSRPGIAERVVGFYSHVNAELAREAAAAGIRAYPRGRFWSNLRELLG
jgi:hypothetical protein